MKDLFDKGVSFRTFILNQDSETRAKFMKYYITTSIADELRHRLDKVENKVNILGIVDGLSLDCYINLSVLEKLVSTNKNISLGLITKADAGVKLEKYYKNGVLKVPTFIFLDKDFSEKGAFIEKPKIVETLDNNSLHGAEQQKNYESGKYIDETAIQLLELIEKTS